MDLNNLNEEVFFVSTKNKELESEIALAKDSFKVLDTKLKNAEQVSDVKN